MTDAPQVFISYSHDSPKHKQWVSELAAKLRDNGVNTILDQWDLSPGDDVTLFMDHGLLKSERVLVICTDEYNRKADAGEGGVGYERMILTAELVKSVGTKRFIPIIRNASPDKTTPAFLSTRFYVDLSDGADKDQEFQKLLLELHRVPDPRKPPLGKSPFAVLPSGSEAPATPPRVGKPPEIPGSAGDPKEIYRSAVDICRNGDLLGWRQLAKRVRDPVHKSLAAWRRKYDEDPPESIEAMETAVDEAVRDIASLFVMALVGVESGRDVFRDQRGVLDDLLNVAGWSYSGSSEVVALPSALGYIYQGLHGAMSTATGQLDLAMELAVMSVKEGNSEFRHVWEHLGLMGWGPSLGGRCKNSWEYLASAGDRWTWLQIAFGSETDYRTALCAYYVALNTYELAHVIASGDVHSFPAQRDRTLNVPLCFAHEQSDIKRRAFSLLLRDRAALEGLWSRLNVTEDDMRSYWPRWMEVCQDWLNSVYGHDIFLTLPHRELFEIL
jgi:hypothetical protein